MSTTSVGIGENEEAVEPVIPPTGFPQLTVNGFIEWFKQPLVLQGTGILALFLLTFGNFVFTTVKLWIEPDSYYQHAPLIPLASAYLLYHNREKILKAPIRPTLWPLPLFIVVCVLQIVATWSFFIAPQTPLFLAGLAVLAWMIYGLKRAWHMLPAIGFLIMGLPIWNRIIDENTVDLQIWSTKGAYKMLDWIGMDPYLQSKTVIMLPNFELNIAAACSGMKLTLALLASVVFIVMIAKLKWWGNAVLLAMMLPLAVIINSLRIALIGIVGDKMGHDAGFLMHDYGSYGTLILAFWLLYVTAKKLGWKV